MRNRDLERFCSPQSREIEAECLGEAVKHDIGFNDTTTLERLMPLLRGGCPKYANRMTAIAAVFISGCAGSPSISVLGAYFPDWLFCIVAGVVLAVVVYLMLKRLRAGDLLWPSAVVVPTLVTLFALAVWLMFFEH